MATFKQSLQNLCSYQVLAEIKMSAERCKHGLYQPQYRTISQGSGEWLEIKARPQRAVT